MTWVLHHESDLNNYVAYGENEGNVVKGTYNAKPGKYYLYVYKYENTDGSYVLNINIKGTSDEVPLNFSNLVYVNDF